MTTPLDPTAAARAELAATRKALEDDSTERQSWKTWVIVLLVLTLVSTGIGAAGTWNIVSGRPQSRQSLTVLLDCTTAAKPGEPAHECFDRSVSGQATAVLEIRRGIRDDVVQIRRCAFGTAAEFDACVASALAPLPTPATAP